MSPLAGALEAVRDALSSRRGRVRVLGLGADDAWEPVEEPPPPAYLPRSGPAPRATGRIEHRSSGG